MKALLRHIIHTITLFFIPFAVQAQEVYQPLVKIPGFTDPGTTGNLSTYLVAVFRLGINIAIVLAVVMVIAGGIQYMVSEVANTKSKAKKQILGALGGLVLALASYLILYTINPELTEINLVFENASFSDTSTMWVYETPNGTSEPATLAECEENRKATDSNSLSSSCFPQPPVRSDQLFWSFEGIVMNREVFRTEEKCIDKKSIGKRCQPTQCIDCSRVPSWVPTLIGTLEICSPIEGERPNCQIKTSFLDTIQSIHETIQIEEFDIDEDGHKNWYVVSTWPPVRDAGPNDCALNAHCIQVAFKESVRDQFETVLETFDLQLSTLDGSVVPNGYLAGWIKNPTTSLDLPPSELILLREANLAFGEHIQAHETNVRKEFSEFTVANATLEVNKGACTAAKVGNCTNVGGLQEETIQSIKDLATLCGAYAQENGGGTCGVTITGGTEWWLHGNQRSDLSGELSNRTLHKPEGIGFGKVIDLSQNSSVLNDFIVSVGQITGERRNNNGSVYAIEYTVPYSAICAGPHTCPSGNALFVDEYGFSDGIQVGAPSGTAPHWHIEF